MLLLSFLFTIWGDSRFLLCKDSITFAYFSLSLCIAASRPHLLAVPLPAYY